MEKLVGGLEQGWAQRLLWVAWQQKGAGGAGLTGYGQRVGEHGQVGVAESGRRISSDGGESPEDGWEMVGGCRVG